MNSLLSNTNASQITIFVVFLLTGISFIGLSIPLLMNKIPPNDWYGFRVPKTVSNETIWYKANRYMARDFLILGIIHLVFTISCSVYNLIGTRNIWILLIGGTGILSLGTIILVIRSFLYLRKL